jgi:ubiquinone biosynthesis protein UbiJ
MAATRPWQPDHLALEVCSPLADLEREVIALKARIERLEREFGVRPPLALRSVARP